MFALTKVWFNQLPRFGGTVHIPKECREKIETIFRSFNNSPYDALEISHFEKTAGNVLRTYLPSNVMTAIAEVRDGERGYIEITGTPRDEEIPPTPLVEGVFEKQKKTYVCELTSLGLIHLFHSKVYNFRQEGWGTGALIFNIFPQVKYAKIKGAGGVENDFRLHMENAWHPQTPDGLILKGIRPDHDKAAITYAVANREIVEALSSEEIQELKKSQFRIRPPEVHRIMEKEKMIPFAADADYQGPVLSEEKGGQCLRINFNGMSASTELGQKALEKIETVARRFCGEVRLDVDNLICVNNRRSIHTRNGFKARFDGNDRLFQRYFFLSPQKLWRNSSVGPSDFRHLSPSDAQKVIDRLEQNGILKNGILTPLFQPYDRDFVLPIQKEFAEDKELILKALIRKGPSYPNRVI